MKKITNFNVDVLLLRADFFTSVLDIAEGLSNDPTLWGIIIDATVKNGNQRQHILSSYFYNQ